MFGTDIKVYNGQGKEVAATTMERAFWTEETAETEGHKEACARYAFLPNEYTVRLWIRRLGPVIGGIVNIVETC